MFTCKIEKPNDKESDEFEAWEMVNGLMLSWILNLVEKHITFTLMHTNSVASTWKGHEEHYNQGYGPLMYQIRYELANLH